jgi:hypothetical protein
VTVGRSHVGLAFDGDVSPGSCQKDELSKHCWTSQQCHPPRQVAGWKAGDYGSLLKPPQWMKLAGPWTGGKPPEEQTAAAGG